VIFFISTVYVYTGYVSIQGAQAQAGAAKCGLKAAAFNAD
jgi:hypothetical protein